MRLVSKSKLDLLDESQFVRPVQLHRRDPRFADSASGDGAPADSKEDIAEQEERERQEQARAEKKRVREENQSQIAPTGKTQKIAAFQKKTEQNFNTDDTPEQQKKNQLRYEEALPWLLEDFGSDPKNRQIWQATYEAALSENFLAIIPHSSPDINNGVPHFSVIPLEKFYRFKEKPKFKTFSMEEREEVRKRKIRPARWELRERQDRDREQEMLSRDGGIANTGMALRRGMRGELIKSNERQKKSLFKREEGDEDVIDFDLEEEFADDEENELFEGDVEESKEAKDKIRKDQFAANTFDNIDPKAIEEEEERKKREREIRKALEKNTRKALVKRERNNEYETDSDTNPYASESASEDSDEERTKEEERRKEEEAKLKGEKPPSGTSTRGSNTPSGRASKHGAPSMQKTLSTNSLKRATSPNASDLSGNESSRKKQKKTHLPSASASISRPMSPEGSRQPSSTNLKKRPAGAGSGSDTDSVAAKPKRIKLANGASPNGSPAGSRAGSPAVGSRAGSPGASAKGTKLYNSD